MARRFPADWAEQRLPIHRPVPDRTDCRAFCSLPLWHKRPDATPDGTVPKALTLPQVFALPREGSDALLLLLLRTRDHRRALGQQLPDPCAAVPAQTAASFASLFYIGITVGRGVCGFLTLKLSDDR